MAPQSATPEPASHHFKGASVGASFQRGVMDEIAVFTVGVDSEVALGLVHGGRIL